MQHDCLKIVSEKAFLLLKLQGKRDLYQCSDTKKFDPDKHPRTIRYLGLSDVWLPLVFTPPEGFREKQGKTVITIKP